MDRCVYTHVSALCARTAGGKSKDISDLLLISPFVHSPSMTPSTNASHPVVSLNKTSHGHIGEMNTYTDKGVIGLFMN